MPLSYPSSFPSVYYSVLPSACIHTLAFFMLNNKHDSPFHKVWVLHLVIQHLQTPIPLLSSPTSSFWCFLPASWSTSFPFIMVIKLIPPPPHEVYTHVPECKSLKKWKPLRRKRGNISLINCCLDTATVGPLSKALEPSLLQRCFIMADFGLRFLTSQMNSGSFRVSVPHDFLAAVQKTTTTCALTWNPARFLFFLWLTGLYLTLHETI